MTLKRKEWSNSTYSCWTLALSERIFLLLFSLSMLIYSLIRSGLEVHYPDSYRKHCHLPYRVRDSMCTHSNSISYYYLPKKKPLTQATYRKWCLMCWLDRFKWGTNPCMDTSCEVFTITNGFMLISMCLYSLVSYFTYRPEQTVSELLVSLNWFFCFLLMSEALGSLTEVVWPESFFYTY